MKDTPLGQAFEPENVFTVGALPAGFDRVLLLPPTDPSGALLSSELTDAFLSSLNATSRFQVISAADWQPTVSSLKDNSPLLSNQPLSGETRAVAARMGADGILELHLSHFRGYKPLRIGVKSRLIDLQAEQGKVLWEIDEVFDAGQRSVATGARRYAEQYIEQRYPLQTSYSVLMSPIRFAGYVGYEIFNTLPSQP